MTKLKFLAAAAVVAVTLPIAMPASSFAADRAGHGGGGYRGGGGPAMRMGGGGAAPAARMGAGAPGARFGAANTGRVGGPGGAAAFAGGPRGWRGGGGWGPGAFAAGAAIGSAAALGGSYAYYPGPDYYADSDYDYGYGYGPDYYGSDVAVVPGAAVGAEDASSYCAQRFRSYDPASGTYLGYDGQRHPCP